MIAAAVASVALGGWSLALGGAASVAVGAFVLLRRPGNRVGAALMAFGSASVLSDFSLGYLVSAEVGAVLRYRLYDIDRIVSRTVTYALVVGLLVAVYAGAAALLTRVLPVESDLAVAAATLAAAALLTPLRRSIQHRVDRRFNRTRYIAEQEMESFTGRLRDTTDVAALQADLEAVIQRTLQPATIGVWIRIPG
jgi:hypothetical protein